MSPPNIVVIMADDLGFGDLGAFSNGSVETPHIDSLAESGTTLSQHYSASPICAPARAAFLTGRYPQRTGVIDTFPHRGLDALALRENTIAELLSASGYRTGLVGKWHNGALGDDYHPNRRGFEEFIGFRGGVQDYWDWRLERNGAPYPADGRYLTDVLSDEAVDFVNRREGEPFFLFLAFTAPHGPFQAPASDLDAVRARRGPGPILVDTIAAMVEVMDRGIGRLLQALDRAGVADETLVLFTSDNGPWMRPGSPDVTTMRYNLGLAGGKEFVLEGGIRVPALIRWPGRVPPGVVNHDRVHFIDWLPTFCGLAGVDPSGLPRDGIDVSASITGAGASAERHHFWQWSRYMPNGQVNSAVRAGSWKLAYPADERAVLILASDPIEERRLRDDPDGYQPPEGGFAEPPPFADVERSPQLFNIGRDPAETLDLASEDPELAGALAADLDDWYAEVEAERLEALGHGQSKSQSP